MPIAIRQAGAADMDAMLPLLLEDGQKRAATDPALWNMDPDARTKLSASLQAAMNNPNPPFRQQWLLAETNGRIVGLTHTILLPVPPIYAGDFGAPGLIMEDCALTDDAPTGTAQALLDAAESDLTAAGAKIILASSVPGGAWENIYTSNDYEPLTRYFAKTGLRAPAPLPGVRGATANDIPQIVGFSNACRRLLFDLNAFWKPHADADTRFGAWMHKSLTLRDRDIFISQSNGDFTGYAISQPATPLHFPPAHDIGAIGVIDDFHHADIADPAQLHANGSGASALFRAAEAALKARGNFAALVVCPAAWTSKIAILKAAGYRNAITWFKKRQG